MIDSKGIEDVLRVFREADEESFQAYEEQKACEDKQNDILHDFELVEHSHNERGHLGKELTQVRRQRRVAKNTLELLAPLCDWISKNQAAINALQRTLGEMRKVEEKQKNRLYRRKADGKGEIIGAARKEEE
ncbi:MAG: hypothetical protein IKO07_06200 [Clostridia bacterium]|nr:hypothetical protein [Clostridia bacterium]